MSVLKGTRHLLGWGIICGAVLGMVFLAQEIVIWWEARPAVLDKRTPLAVVRDLEREGLSAVPLVVPSYFLSSPLSILGRQVQPVGAISSRPTVFCNEEGDYLIYQSDRYGFHNPNGFGGSGRGAVIVGDSYAQGACVPSARNLAAQLEPYFSTVTNLGMARNGPLMELASLREYGLALHPRRVYWLYYSGNDLDDLASELSSPILLNYLNAEFSQGLMRIPFSMDSEIEARALRDLEAEAASGWRMTDWWALGPGRRWVARALSARALPGNEKTIPLFMQIIALAREEVADNGGVLEFVYLPTWAEVLGSAGSTNSQRTKGWIEAMHVPFIDVREAFLLDGNPERFFPLGPHGHYSVAGYAKLAEAILSQRKPSQKVAKGLERRVN